jgi:hypothetical protein
MQVRQSESASRLGSVLPFLNQKMQDKQTLNQRSRRATWFNLNQTRSSRREQVALTLGIRASFSLFFSHKNSERL